MPKGAELGLPKARASFSPTLSELLVSHSQTVTTDQPRSRKRSAFFSSRRTFESNLCCQKSILLFGVLAFAQPGCRCQKQPWTNIATFHFGNTISGVPGRSFRCRRNRRPNECAIRLTTISGVVFLPPTRDISQDRRTGVSRSTKMPTPPLTENAFPPPCAPQ